MPRLDWEETLGVLAEFITEYGRLPKRSEIYRGIDLDKWRTNQLKALRAGKYSPERIAQLAALGITLNSHDSKWEQNFHLLQAFYAEYGRFPMQKENYHDTKLGQWCANQRRDVTNGKCTAERRKKLEEIGFIQSSTYDSHWEECYRNLQQFLAENNRFPLETEQYNQINLGKWCSNQKRQAKQAEYPKERKEKLEAIGLFATTQEARWEQNYQLLQQYKAENKRLPKRQETYQGIQLGQWCAEQKRKAGTGKYKAERKAKLESIGLLEKEVEKRNKGETIKLHSSTQRKKKTYVDGERCQSCPYREEYEKAVVGR